MSLQLLSDVILAKAAAGKSVVMAGSGVGLLTAMDLETGTHAPTIINAASSRHAERTARTQQSADAVARVFKKGE